MTITLDNLAESLQTLFTTEADQAAKCVADEVSFLGSGRVEHGEGLVGHRRDAVIVGQIALVASGAGLVVGDDAMACPERRKLRRPVARRAAEARREQDGRRAGPLALVDVVKAHFLPMWAIDAISTRASGLTRPHWMQ